MVEGLTAKQVAELKGCTVQYVRKMAETGKLKADIEIDPSNGRPRYLIPLSSLPSDLQRRHYLQAQQTLDIHPAPPAASPDTPKAYGDFSGKEREDIDLWNGILLQWEAARQLSPNKTDANAEFVESIKSKWPDIQISIGTLYRKRKARDTGNLQALVENRGGWNRGQNAIPLVVWDAFRMYYYSQQQLPIVGVHELVTEWARQYYPEFVELIPSPRTFAARLAREPEALKTLGRRGKAALGNEYTPHITRTYEGLQSNDIWIADNHTWDIITHDRDGKKHRQYLTAFIDARSGILTGWNITDTPDSQSTIIALMHGIRRCGIPKGIYVDNGTEFLVHDIGGLGHRSRKSQAGVYCPPTILQHLGITMLNALPGNAKAKPIERTFGTLCNQISRLYETYTGGAPHKRPENLVAILKAGRVPGDDELRGDVEAMLEGYNHRPYGGAVRTDRGKARQAVWLEQLIERCVADDADLRLMMMRTTLPQKVGRNGVRIKFGGYKLPYWEDDLWKYQGKMVYARYDPDDVREVHIYSAEEADRETYLDTWRCRSDTIIPFLAAHGDVAKAMQSTLTIGKEVREQLRAIRKAVPADQRDTPVSLAVKSARRLVQNTELPIDAAGITRIYAQNKPVRRAVGDASHVDLRQINENILRQRGGKLE